jgi:hypothetical protein
VTLKYGREQLVADVESWLQNKDVLDKARDLLGHGTLSDSDLANWRRRRIPPALFEGAALDYFGRERSLDTPQQARVIGRESWQAFTVSPQENHGSHDCTVLRLWTGVRKTISADEAAFLTHRTWYSGEWDPNPKVIDLITDEPHTSHPIAISPDNKGGIVAIAWELASDEPKDFGYKVRLKSTVSSGRKNGPQYEYLGGMVGIPVDRLVLLIRLPQNLLKMSDDKLSLHKFSIPRCLQFLPDGVPFKTLEQFLAGGLDRRWLGPYFNVLGQASVTGADIKVPEVLRTELAKAESGEGATYVEFTMEIQNPAPYLCYAWVFDLPNIGT